MCSLLSEPQLREFEDLLGRYREAFGPDRVLHAPVEDHTLADPETLATVLSFLEAAHEADEPVVVHCLAGIGRTGQVLAAWLVHAHDYEPVAALETVANRHRRPDDAVRSGNATREQLLGLLQDVDAGGG